VSAASSKPPDNARHLSKSVEHFTPAHVVEAARTALGGIDLDPASCTAANTIVRADTIFTADDDGLVQTWFGRVFLNPPGKVPGSPHSLAPLFWRKLASEYGSGNVRAAVYLAFTLEQLAQFQDSALRPTHVPFCILRSRLAFLTERDRRIVRQGSPTHANAVVFLPPRDEREEAVVRFERAFSPLGDVVVPQVRSRGATSP
jgi:ParB family chromosome partitioning protein